MTVQSRVLESGTMSWESLCVKATEFATAIKRENLINISATVTRFVFMRTGS
jgi:hypothetical protein